jgi:hypothetical protein
VADSGGRQLPCRSKGDRRSRGSVPLASPSPNGQCRRDQTIRNAGFTALSSHPVEPTSEGDPEAVHQCHTLHNPPPAPRPSGHRVPPRRPRRSAEPTCGARKTAGYHAQRSIRDDLIAKNPGNPAPFPPAFDGIWPKRPSLRAFWGTLEGARKRVPQTSNQADSAFIRGESAPPQEAYQEVL